MTQEQFDKLPGLITRAQFIAVTGLDDNKLRAELEAGAISSYRTKPLKHKGCKKSYRRYYKRDAARIGGFVMR